MTPNGDFDAAFKDALEEVLGWDVELSEDDGPGTVEGWHSLMQIRLVHALDCLTSVRRMMTGGSCSQVHSPPIAQ